MATIVYRACRRTDLVDGFGVFFNYGLANHRGSDVNANFTQHGYATNAVSTTTDPLVAFMYGCIQPVERHEIAVFAITVEDEVLRSGSVKLQAMAQGISENTQCWRSVDAQSEVVLPNVKRSDILGFYTIRMRGSFYDLGEWHDIGGNVHLRNLSRDILQTTYMDFAKQYGGLVSLQIVQNEIDRLMGG